METAQAVERGAELLDRLEPGWAEIMDVELLDISNPETCVLGQVYRDRSLTGANYLYALDVLGAAVEVEAYVLAVTYGFDHHPMDDLQRLWTHQIAIRT